MITDHVPAVRVPPDHTASSRPAVVRARGNVEERRDLDPAPSVLRHNQPCRPKLTWADRALFATLLSVIPKARRQGLRLLVTPDTILRWHRELPARSARPGNAAAPAGLRMLPLPARTSRPRRSLSAPPARPPRAVPPPPPPTGPGAQLAGLALASWAARRGSPVPSAAPPPVPRSPPLP